MMLRASSSANDLQVDLSLVMGEAGENEAVEHALELADLVDTSVTNLGSLAAARSALVEATDSATMLDAAAVVANFEMMTRIADGTGTCHPSERLESMAEMTTSMGLDQFVSARSCLTRGLASRHPTRVACRRNKCFAPLESCHSCPCNQQLNDPCVGLLGRAAWLGR